MQGYNAQAVATGRTGKPRKDGKPSGSKSDGLRTAMFAKLGSEQGKACYALRKQTVEPVRRSGSCCAAPTTCSSVAAYPPSDRTSAARRLSRGEATLAYRADRPCG